MASVRPSAPDSPPETWGPASVRPVPKDEDDGIHIASVRRADGSDGPVVRAVVAWFEDGQRVETTVELPDAPAPTAGPDDVLLRSGVKATALSLGVSERTLRRRFAKRGTRPNDRRAALRREGTLALLGGDLPIAAVASRLGFSSSQTFARFVRRVFGTTASAVRRRVRAKAGTRSTPTDPGRVPESSCSPGQPSGQCLRSGTHTSSGVSGAESPPVAGTG